MGPNRPSNTAKEPGEGAKTVGFRGRHRGAGSRKLTRKSVKVAAASALLVVPALAAVSAVAPWASASAAHPVAQKAKVASKVTVSAAPGTAVAGTVVKLSATVTSSGATPTGTVIFWWGKTKLCGAALSHASTHCTTEFKAAGTYTVTAKYSGDGSHASASGTTRAKATLAATSTVLSASTVTPYPGQAVTLTATVTSRSRLVPTGSVKFSDAGGTLCTGTIAGGKAHCTAEFGAVGSYTVTGRYSGDKAHAGSAGTGRVKAALAATTTAVAVTTLTAYPDEAETLTATVTSHSGAVPAGTVTFSDAGGTLCTGNVAAGTAACAADFAAVGTYTVTGKYSGDAALNGSTGMSGTITVAKLATTTEITDIPATVTAGNPATITVTVTTPAGTAAATGAVDVVPTDPTLAGDAGFSCTVTLVAGDDGTGSCNVTPPADTIGLVDYQATYAGDAAHTGSASSATEPGELLVQDTTMTTVAFATATDTEGTEDTITATVVNTAGTNISETGGGTGTVTFSVDGTDIVDCSDVALTYTALTGNTATCDFTPTPGEAGTTVAVLATYSGDAVNITSMGTGDLPVST